MFFKKEKYKSSLKPHAFKGFGLGLIGNLRLLPCFDEQMYSKRPIWSRMSVCQEHRRAAILEANKFPLCGYLLGSYWRWCPNGGRSRHLSLIHYLMFRILFKIPKLRDLVWLIDFKLFRFRVRRQQPWSRW